MIKEYFSFEFKNWHRQIHYGMSCFVSCILISILTILDLSLKDFQFVGNPLFYENILIISFLIHSCCGIFSKQKLSGIFLTRVIDSPMFIYGTKLSVIAVTAIESLFYFIISKLITTSIFCQLSGQSFNFSNLINELNIFFIAPIIIGIVVTIDLRISHSLINLILCYLILIIFIGGGIYLNKINFLNHHLNFMQISCMLILGACLWLINGLPVINKDFFKRIDHANYSN